MKSVIDQFGEDVETQVIDNERFRAKVQVNVSQTFFAWVFQFNGDIRIYGPAEIVTQYREMLERLLLQLSM